MALVEELDVFPTLLDIAGLPQPPQQVHGASLMPLLQDPTRVSFKSNASFSQYPRKVAGRNFMGLTMRVAEWRFTEWCAFNYTRAYPIWESSDPFACELELYDHIGDNGTEFDRCENENVAYEARHRELIKTLHNQLLESWDNGLGPPPAVAPPSGPGPLSHSFDEHLRSSGED